MDKKTKKLVEAYNWPGSLLVISSYPEKGVRYSGKVCAVGGFTKNTLDALSSYYSEQGKPKKIVVLTVTIDKEEIYEEDGVLVWRVFERNKPLSYLKLLRAISRFSRIKNTLVEFEFASYGNTKTTAFFPSVLALLRLLRKNTVLVLHQVIDDLGDLSGHLGWKKGELRAKTINAGLKGFYWLMSLFSDKVVTLEETFKKRLEKIGVSENKIVVIPHGVDRRYKGFSKETARKQLGVKKDEHLILYFGYLTWYKGVDFLLRAFGKKLKVNGRPVRLIVAGGESTTQKTKPHYQTFVKRVYSLASRAKDVSITGFVDEKDIPLYFAAADLVVLPYRTFMSSSGPLSLSCTFGKPFLISSTLGSYFETGDFAEALEQAGLSRRDIVFPFSVSGFRGKLSQTLEEEKLEKLSSFSKSMAKRRDFDSLAPQYASVIAEAAELFQPVPELRFKLSLRR